MKEIKALTWKEPFATLMLHDKIETRSWHTNYRGWVLICAGKKSYSREELFNICGEAQYNRICNMVLPTNPDFYGNAIAVGKLVACRLMTPEDEALCFVKYRLGLYCHIYENVRRIEMFPFKGSQKWKNLTDIETASAIFRYLNIFRF